jgi:putative ABC transport system ATP-binding protein
MTTTNMAVAMPAPVGQPQPGRLPGPAGPPGTAGPPGLPADAVVLSNVSKRYGRRRGGVEALTDVTARFPRGSFTAVMGLSGSGKSTLLQCAAGLDKPSSGSVHLGSLELTTLSRRKLTVARRERVGFVFQALNLVPTLSVAENIALPLRLGRRRVDQARIHLLAERVGLADQLRRLPDTLSGGQQQRVAIARALITEPQVVFADEPTANLDLCTAEDVLDLLRGAVDDLGQTVIVVTHDPIVAARADRALLLDRGHLAGMVDSPDPAQLTAALRELGRARR